MGLMGLGLSPLPWLSRKEERQPRTLVRNQDPQVPSFSWIYPLTFSLSFLPFLSSGLFGLLVQMVDQREKKPLVL